MHVRPATPDDIPWMLAQAQAFNEFVGTRHQVFHPESSRKVLESLVGQHPVFVADDNGTPAGFLVAVAQEHLFNPQLFVLTELLWWVQPEYRATRAAALLLHAFEECGKRLAVDWMVMCLEHHSPLNPGALEKRGYRAQERTFLKEI